MSRLILTVLFTGLIPAAHAQFQLFVLSAGVESPVSAVYSFGAVSSGDTVSADFRIRNVSDAPAELSLLSVRGVGFALVNGPDVPLLLNPGAAVDFAVTFSATGLGGYSAALDSVGIAVLLTAVVQPKPHLVIDLPRVESGQQGSVTVRFDAPAKAGGSGTVTLEFRSSVAGASDPAIAFASGARTATFSFAAGDTQGSFGGQRAALFQTGSTAGVLVLTAQMSGASDQQTLTLASSAVAVSAAEGAKSTAGLEVRVTGFDNTRTAGALAFTFFDAAGTAIPPGTIRADAASAFSQYFQGSQTGGTFLLRAVFPVAGDSSLVASFEAAISNSAGSVTTPRTSF